MGSEHIKEYQWKPGQSGNPKGRPRRPSFEAIVATVLDEQLPGSDITKREALARVFVDAMLKRNGQMIREFLLREWPAVTKHEVDFPGAEPNDLEAALDRFLAAQGEVEVPRKPNGNGSA